MAQSCQHLQPHASGGRRLHQSHRERRDSGWEPILPHRREAENFKFRLILRKEKAPNIFPAFRCAQKLLDFRQLRTHTTPFQEYKINTVARTLLASGIHALILRKVPVIKSLAGATASHFVPSSIGLCGDGRRCRSQSMRFICQ